MWYSTFLFYYNKNCIAFQILDIFLVFYFLVYTMCCTLPYYKIHLITYLLIVFADCLVV